MYYCCGITDRGIMPHNEDSLLIGRHVINIGSSEQKLESPFIAAVSDGVSGETSGEMASELCLRLVRNINFRYNAEVPEQLMQVHSQLSDFSRENPQFRNMQATLCGIAVDENENVISFNVGDSRLYLFREGCLRQISRDQSFVQLLYEEGSIPFHERRTHKRRHIIFPAFGNLRSAPKIDVLAIEGGMKFGDVLLLCTDGLSDFISLSEIQEILELPKGLPVRLEMMLKRAIERKCSDNISIVAVVYCEE